MVKTYKDITYNLKRSDRKTASIYVERDGEISVYVPNKLEDEEIEKVIEHKRIWIYKNLAEWRDLNAAAVQREYIDGEGFPYLGRNYRLQIVQDQTAPLLLKNGYFFMSGNLSAEKAREAFKNYYKDKGQVIISERVSYYEKLMGLNTKEIRVMDLQNRWGSCARAGNINFHWKCIMAPLKILDYIVVHELAHIKVQNHSDAFWNEVDKIMPDYLSRKEKLRILGPSMDL